MTVFAGFFGSSGGAPSALSNAAKIDAVETSPWPASVKAGFTAAIARRARQKLSATMATALVSLMIFFTPGMASAGVVSKGSSVPPFTGAISIAA